MKDRVKQWLNETFNDTYYGFGNFADGDNFLHGIIIRHGPNSTADQFIKTIEHAFAVSFDSMELVIGDNNEWIQLLYRIRESDPIITITIAPWDDQVYHTELIDWRK
jgi:hypothetical protein